MNCIDLYNSLAKFLSFQNEKSEGKSTFKCEKNTIEHGYSEHAYIEQTQQSDFCCKLGRYNKFRL